MQPEFGDAPTLRVVVPAIRVLGKPLKKQENANKQKTSERAVYAFQHAVLRLSDYGKRARDKAIVNGTVQHNWRTHSVSNLLHHQRLRVRSVGLRQGSTAHLAWLCHEFPLCAFGALCDVLPAAPYWHNEEGFHAIFGLAPRIALASFLAFLVGSFVNAYVMSRMKISSGGKNFSARAIMSTVYGETADSIIFFPLALGGVVPTNELPVLIISQVVLKTLYEIVILPVTIRVVKATKRHEGEDAYDNGMNYSVWKIFNI